MITASSRWSETIREGPSVSRRLGRVGEPRFQKQLKSLAREDVRNHTGTASSSLDKKAPPEPSLSPP